MPKNYIPPSENTRRLQRRAHHLIPGGAHTYAKGDDQYPECAPPFLVRGLGCHVWDLEGNEFIEYGMGLRSVALGHAHPRVVAAATAAMTQGQNFVRPSCLELECAEQLLKCVSGDMVKFAKNGSDITTAAVKLARAYTRRPLVAVCQDHPFFSVDDWFIGTTSVNAGIPQEIQDLTLRFRYNDLAGLRALLESRRDEVACIILEAATSIEPDTGFLQGLRELCNSHGCILIFDEMITGFRWHLGGAQAVYGVTPDLAAFGKAMANGFSLSALVGQREIMSRGGLYHDQDRVFLLSTTHGSESVALGAALATMQVYCTEPVIETMYARGERLRRGVNDAAKSLGINDYFSVVGRASNLVYVTRDGERNQSQVFRTIFMQEIIQRGVIGPSFVVSYAHSEDDVDRTIEAAFGALQIYRNALEAGPELFLKGQAVKPVYRRRNR